MGPIFLRPKAIGHSIDLGNGWGRLFTGTVTTLPTTVYYQNAGLPYPGVWRVEGIGAGGGGGGQDSYYPGQPGQGGRPGTYFAVTVTLGGLPLNINIGRGGAGGLAGNSPSNGGAGGPTNVVQSGLSVVSVAGGDGGFFGSLGSASGRDPVPPPSSWEGGVVGRGGYGSQSMEGGYVGYPGNVRLKLIG